MTLKSRLKKLIEPPVKSLLPYYIKFDQNRNDRPGAVFKAWGLVVTNKMKGGYYEFGVYKGETFRESYRIYREYVDWMQSQSRSDEIWRRKVKWESEHQFYAFDTFEGMPENSENNENFAKGTFLGSLEEVKTAGEKVGMVEGDRIKYFKGLFSDIAKNQSEEIEKLPPAVIVNIDCDLYASTVDVLEIIAPKLQQGTVLLMDDYNYFCVDRNQGGRRALREFLEKHPEVEVEKWFPYSHLGQAFIVHIKNSSN